MKSSTLTYRHFIGAVIARSLTHAASFSLVISIFLSIVFGGNLLNLLTFPLLCTLYISSYAIHELGHYYCAVWRNARPVLWIDFNSVSVLSNPRKFRDGQLIALAGPLVAICWIFIWWGAISLFLPALCFAALIPGGLLASAHLGSLLPVFSDGKALTQYQVKRSYL